MPNIWLPCLAGLPPDNQNTHCSSTTKSCYYHLGSEATYQPCTSCAYTAARSICAGMGGYLVVPNTYAEQREYEQ